jgi:hypothetical protein
MQIRRTARWLVPTSFAVINSILFVHFLACWRHGLFADLYRDNTWRCLLV